MRIFLLAISILFSLLVEAQLTVRSIHNPVQRSQSIRTQNRTVSQASLPFWDDFSLSSSDSPDSIRVWESDTALQWDYDLSRDVFLNSTLAVNPPSLNVVTFDGLDANGAFHAGTDIGLADELVSQTIDLQGKIDVILSFYWQAGGNVEIPDEGDSLVLQFYGPVDDTTRWITHWKIDGGDLTSSQDSVFTQEAISVPTSFRTQEFRFRFQSYGDKDGPFDAWHLDYIFLDENRSNDDFYYEDTSLSSLPSSPIQPYTSIPANQFLSNISKFAGSISVTATTLEKPDASGIGVPGKYQVEFRELVSNTFIDSTNFGSKPLIPVNLDPFSAESELIVETSDYDLSSLPLLDSMVLESKVFLLENIDTLFNPENIDQFNDTIVTQSLFHNYYAFDDGTAEYAVGTNIDGAQVAVQFWLEEMDTLTHVNIHFPNIDPLSQGAVIQLRVFKNLNEDPIRTQDVTVTTATQINEFTPYKLNAPLILSDTFYIGYEQSINEYIGIGFDRSNPAASEFIYENKTGLWEQNTRLTGAIMIRPVFEQIDSLVLSTKVELPKLKAYPNPTSGILQIDGTYETITLMDFSGRIWVQEAQQKRHDLTNLKTGLYLLTIHRKGGDQTLKIIKK